MCDGHAHAHAHEHEHAHPHGAAFRAFVSGKGGVGKTSIVAILARLLARSAYRVLALDADPQMNLAHALGLPRREARAIVPLGRNEVYIEEKTGARPSSCVLLRLNPDARDVVGRFGVLGPDGVRLLVMGTVEQPATGCLCPASALLQGVVEAMRLRDDEAILLDTQAGVEHFGRALARGFHHAAVVTDATYAGVEVALRAARLARALGIPAIHLVLNRVRGEADLDHVRRIMDEEGGFAFTSGHVLPYDERLVTSDSAASSLLDGPRSPLVEAIGRLCDALVRTEREMAACAS